MSVDSFRSFAPRTQFNFHKIDLPFIDTNKVVPMGVDIGYASVKVYSVFGHHIFPSFPIKVRNDFNMAPKSTYIKYKDERGRLWYVGEVARKVIETGKIPAQSQTLFGRQRINSEEYLVLLRLGIFFGLLKRYDEDHLEYAKNVKLKIKSGLPEDYIIGDTNTLKERFHGHHNFKVQLGHHDWVNVSFDIDMNKDEITVISQPFGTLWSMVGNRYGEIENYSLLEKNVLIYDGGFHTIDTFFNLGGVGQGTSSTWDDLAMHEVYKRTIEDILKATGGKGPSYEYLLDKYIDSDENPGEVFYENKQRYQFRQDFIRNLEAVAKESIEQLDTMYNKMADVDVIIMTGGTGKAYYPFFKARYDLDGLQVLLAEKNDSPNPVENFSPIFANVVGYFNCLMAEMRSEVEEDKETENLVAATTENSEN